jgi:hypothetical protein
MNRPHPEEFVKAANDLRAGIEMTMYDTWDSDRITYRTSAIWQGKHMILMSYLHLLDYHVKIDSAYFDGRCRKIFKYDDYHCIEDLVHDVLNYIHFVYTKHAKFDKPTKKIVKACGPILKQYAKRTGAKVNIDSATISQSGSSALLNVSVVPLKSIENITVSFNL